MDFDTEYRGFTLAVLEGYTPLTAFVFAVTSVSVVWLRRTFDNLSRSGHHSIGKWFYESLHITRHVFMILIRLCFPSGDGF